MYAQRCFHWTDFHAAIEFLLEHKFEMSALYRTGVTYVSREEEARAISKAQERCKMAPVLTSMDFHETDYESLAFLGLVRKVIDEWIALGDVKVHC